MLHCQMAQIWWLRKWLGWIDWKGAKGDDLFRGKPTHDNTRSFYALHKRPSEKGRVLKGDILVCSIILTDE